MPLIKPKPSAYILLAAIALTLAALMPALHNTQIYLISGDQANVQRRHDDAGGQTASPNPGDSGFDQEEKVRQLLAKQYDQLYADEKSIRQFLKMQGKTADFLGHNSAADEWVIAESKASNVDHAWEQLKNTTEAFLRLKPNATFEVRLYLDDKTFQLLSNADRPVGWVINSEGYLGWVGDAKEFMDAIIEGTKVRAFAVP